MHKITVARRGSEYLFDQIKVRSYELILSQKNLKKLNNNPMAEEYIPGSLVFEGDTLKDVGIRYKGSLGSFWGCVSKTKKSGWPLGGKKTCSKLSMKVKIDMKEDRDFYDLQKLQFHSMNNYASQMKERLGYWIFGESGIPTPRAVHAKLYINGKHTGLFTLVEQIDEIFVERHFNNSHGALLKEVWPTLWNGKVTPDSVIESGLKTEADASSINIFKGFALDMQKARSRQLRETFAQWTNVHYMATYAAVDRAIMNNDGAFHWWHKGRGVTRPHNFFWYADPDTKKNYIIPWDLDMAFDNSAGMKIDKWGQRTNRCKVYKNQRSAACDKVVRGWVKHKKEYTQAQIKLLEGPLAQANTQIDLWEKQIEDAVKESYKLHRREPKTVSYKKFKKGIRQLKKKINRTIASLKVSTKKDIKLTQSR